MSRRRRPQVIFGSQDLVSWQQEIAQSAVFFCLLSPAYLRTPRLWEHIAYAKQLGKPCRVAVIEGAEIPEGLFSGVTDLEIRVCATPDDVHHFVLEVIR